MRALPGLPTVALAKQAPVSVLAGERLANALHNTLPFTAEGGQGHEAERIAVVRRRGAGGFRRIGECQYAAFASVRPFQQTPGRPSIWDR